MVVITQICRKWADQNLWTLSIAHTNTIAIPFLFCPGCVKSSVRSWSWFCVFGKLLSFSFFFIHVVWPRWPSEQFPVSFLHAVREEIVFISFGFLKYTIKWMWSLLVGRNNNSSSNSNNNHQQYSNEWKRKTMHKKGTKKQKKHSTQIERENKTAALTNRVYFRQGR